jgi:hypothetical protein
MLMHKGELGKAAYTFSFSLSPKPYAFGHGISYAAILPPQSLHPQRRVAGEERSKATPPFDFAQDREPVERRFGFTQGHELVEWQMMP